MRHAYARLFVLLMVISTVAAAAGAIYSSRYR